MARELRDDISDSATTIPVNTYLNNTDFPIPGTIQIDSEIIRYNNLTDKEFIDCIRGYNSTTAAAHAKGDQVAFDAVIPAPTTGVTFPLAIPDGLVTAPSLTFGSASMGLFFSPAGSYNKAIAWSDNSVVMGMMADDGLRLIDTNSYITVQKDGSLSNGSMYFGAGAASWMYGSDTSIGFAFFSGSNKDMIQMDNDSTSGNTRLLIYDTDSDVLQRVKVGPNDSGGTGFRSLVIDNV